jgi:hypothetical protein
MRNHSFDAPETRDEVEITLDGLPVGLPSGCRSLNAIRCRLETLALERQRILCSLNVDGQPVNLALPLLDQGTCRRVEAGTVALEETPVLLLTKALQQTAHAREYVETALTLVLINDGQVAREVWWNLASVLKEPVLTLSLLPENICQPVDNRTSLAQLATGTDCRHYQGRGRSLPFGRHHSALQRAGKPRAAVAAKSE